MKPILLSLFVLASALAQTPPPDFQALQWRLIGPFRGGRSIAVTGVPGNPALFYFGAVGGGIWKSTDAGTVWNSIFDHQPVASIGALEVAPSNPQILYAGTGEADIRSDIAFGQGVYRSDDGGAHWRNIGLRDTFQIGRIVVHPHNSRRGLRGGARTRLCGQSGARRVSHQGRRPDVGKGARQGPRHRRDRSGDGT